VTRSTIRQCSMERKWIFGFALTNVMHSPGTGLPVMRGCVLAMGIAAALAVPGPVRAQYKATNALDSAGILAFGPGNVLFVGDIKGATVHAFTLRATDFTPQNIAMGNAHNFEGRDLISGIDVKLGALLGTKPDQILINDMIVHQPEKQIFLSVQRGRGPTAAPVIVKVNNGQLEVLNLDGLPHSKIAIANEPDKQTLEFGQRERSLAITDIKYYNGEIFVTGVSNEEFASTLYRIHYPFDNRVSTSTVEIWHSVHAEFETRAPIIRHLIHEVKGEPYLFAVYACTPLVRIPLAALKDGAHVRGDTIGELGYGSTPIDMLTYADPSDHRDYLLVTNNMRGATRIAIADLDEATPMPVNVPNNFGPAGIAQYSLPVTGAQHLALIDPQWAVEIRRYPADANRLDLHTLPLPYYLDRADQIVEMNWPGGPDPFGYHTKAAKPQ
jgi:hypothetical protein